MLIKSLTFLYNFYLKKIFVNQCLPDSWKQLKKLSLINSNVVYFYASILAYENRSTFLIFSLERGGGLSYHSAQRTLKNIQNSIFSEFLKILKNTLALMASFYQITFSYNL